MHPAFVAMIALDAVRERQEQGERLARLLTASAGEPAQHGAARRRLARAVAGVARRLDHQVALSDAPHASHGA
jgi:hypothetical protein